MTIQELILELCKNENLQKTVYIQTPNGIVSQLKKIEEILIQDINDSFSGALMLTGESIRTFKEL